jgi:hypothetical protein
VTRLNVSREVLFISLVLRRNVLRFDSIVYVTQWSVG